MWRCSRCPPCLREAARGAAVDHLGSLLLLWAATDGRAQEIADEIVREHLAWGLGPLRRIQAAGGFYGSVATLAGRWIGALTSEPT